MEIMKVTPAIRNALRQEGGIEQVDLYIEQTRQEGNQLLDTALLQLVETSQIAPQEAFDKANDKNNFEKQLTNKGFLVNASGGLALG
jgi:Tfp pilus assembly pilus retraction ATPase PilT